MEVKCNALGSRRENPISVEITTDELNQIVNCQCFCRQKDSCVAPGYALGKCYYSSGKNLIKEDYLHGAIA